MLDDVDRAILHELAVDARIPNNALAERVGIAPSTCLGRVRALRAGGVIRGFHADIEPRALGRDLQAMISIKLAAHARGSMGPFVERISRQPEVLDVYFVAGANDYLVHVAVGSTEDLRVFVAQHLSRDPDVALTETSLIFEHTRAAGRR
ncbi:DNA-binding Lrp family transcriptional regulator [Kineococcus xinjiangensis]|uniref:DNA-binding Lrp family transcriptional regulator n=1 Tax=Kineococcus xinjiangensis TaxID=512762 RepID=A0A2S6IUE6_9ACTN|nr:DNA-binding Lrp family transcriptional regulator [Kineococcus xinjiangensis]